MTDQDLEDFYAKNTMTLTEEVYNTIYEKKEELKSRKKKKTNVRDTSKESYREEQPKLGTKQNELLVMIKLAKRPPCDAELAKQLGWTNAIVSARRNELMDMGLVEEAGTGFYEPTGKTVTCWRAK